MLKSLRKRFVRIVFFALALLVFVQITCVNAVNILQRDSEVRDILHIISENDGAIPNTNGTESGYVSSFFNPFRRVQITIETPYSTRYFVVKLKGNVVTSMSTHNIAAVSDEDAFEFASRVYEIGTPGFGFVDNYRYYYTVDSSTGKAMMVFIDVEKDIMSTMKFASITILIAIISIILLVLPVKYFSKRAMRPLERSLEKQRQFITDAGHELKTPIAIISADADVLEMTQGENEWLTSIKNQTVRLDGLVKNLVTLSKLEEEKAKPDFTVFDLSAAVTETAQNFETIAKANNVEFIYDIAPAVKLKANETEIKQLISILCDNAVKYTTENGIIKISVYKSGKSVCIDVYNDCEDIEQEKLDMLFDRFYRADSSRSRETGGYGIGLSIAQVSVLRNRGTIKAVKTKPCSITFKIKFSDN